MVLGQNCRNFFLKVYLNTNIKFVKRLIQIQPANYGLIMLLIL